MTNNQVNSWLYDNVPSRLDGKTFIITGANSGIGFEATRIFAKAGAHVVLACRDKEKGEAAVSQIHSKVPNALIELMQLDLASLKSIRTFAKEASTKLKRIDVLINNAGIAVIPYKNYTETDDGFEIHFGINHLGHFALTGLLFDKILASAPSRVVTLTSLAHKRDSKFQLGDIQASHDLRHAYGNSKLANLLFTYELDRRLNARGIDVKSVACHPGVTKSNLINAGPKMAGQKTAWWMRLLYAPAQSTVIGALPEVFAAVGKDIHGADYVGPTGFPSESRGLPKKSQSSELSHNVKMAKQLWALSEKLTGVRFLDE